MSAEPVLSQARRLRGTDQRGEELDDGIGWLILCALCWNRLGVPARLGHRRKHSRMCRSWLRRRLWSIPRLC
jgi:hypothetical protein